MTNCVTRTFGFSNIFCIRRAIIYITRCRYGAEGNHGDPIQASRELNWRFHAKASRRVVSGRVVDCYIVTAIYALPFFYEHCQFSLMWSSSDWNFNYPDQMSLLFSVHQLGQVDRSSTESSLINNFQLLENVEIKVIVYNSGTQFFSNILMVFWSCV